MKITPAESDWTTGTHTVGCVNAAGRVLPCRNDGGERVSNLSRSDPPAHGRLPGHRGRPVLLHSMAVAAGFPPNHCPAAGAAGFPLLARRSGTPARAWSLGRAFPFSPHSHPRRVCERRSRRAIPLRSLHPAVGNDGAEPGPLLRPMQAAPARPALPCHRRDAYRGSAGRPFRREEIIAKQHNGRAGVLTLGAPARCFPVPGRISAVGGESPRPWGINPRVT